MGAGNIGAVAQDLKSRIAAGFLMNGAPHIFPPIRRNSARVLYEVPVSKHTSCLLAEPPTYFFTPRDALDLAIVHEACPPRFRCCGSALGTISWSATAGGGGGGVGGALRGGFAARALGTLERLSATAHPGAGGFLRPHRAQASNLLLGPAEFFADPGTWAAPWR